MHPIYEALLLDAYAFIIVSPSDDLKVDLSNCIKCPYLSLVMLFTLNPILADIPIVTPVFLSYLHVYFFPSIPFNRSVSLYLNYFYLIGRIKSSLEFLFILKMSTITWNILSLTFIVITDIIGLRSIFLFLFFCFFLCPVFF